MSKKDIAQTADTAHYTSWSRRRKDSDGQVIDLLRGRAEEVLGTFTESNDKVADLTARIDDATWSLHFDAEGTATATLPDGRVFTARAAGEGASKGFRRASRVEIDMDGIAMTAINENKNNWIIDDADSVKVAQFSGLNNGVRESVLEFEEGIVPPADQEVFLSWITRKVLEARMLGSSWALTIFLIILTPVIVAIALFP